MRTTDDELIDLAEVARLVGISVTTASRWKAAGQLPRCRSFTRRTHRWSREEVLLWIERTKGRK